MAEHAGSVMMSESRVTVAVRASARPWTIDDAPIVIDASAIMVPASMVFAPSVAEVPIFQNTLQAAAPSMRMTRLFAAVVNVVPIWKMNTACGSPSPSSVNDPVSCAVVSNR